MKIDEKGEVVGDLATFELSDDHLTYTFTSPSTVSYTHLDVYKRQG